MRATPLSASPATRPPSFGSMGRIELTDTKTVSEVSLPNISRATLRSYLLACASSLMAMATWAQQMERPPDTPLITHNPYFSIWSNTDQLTSSPTRHWTGNPQQLHSLVRAEGVVCR